MISGFGGSSVNSDYHHSRVKYSSNLPVPFNMLKVKQKYEQKYYMSQIMESKII